MSDLILAVDAYWISPYALSVFVALEEKGLPYTVREVALQDKAHHAPSYTARTGRVPSLQHGDYVLAESSAIAEYLAETFPFPKYPRLFPEDLKQRGIAREIMAWVRSDLMPIRDERSTHTMFYTRATAPLSPKAQAAAKRLVDGVSQLIRPGKTTLFEQWCLADTDLGVMLQRLNLNGDPLPKALATYAQANWERPSVQKWVKRTRPPYVAY